MKNNAASQKATLSVGYPESFDDLGKRIRAHKLFSKTSLEDVLGECMDFVAQKSALLDLGCGSGNFYELFSSKARTYIGIDISSELLGEFRKRAGESVVLINSGMDELPRFENGCFDAIFSIYSIYYSLRPAELIARLHGLLSDSGHLFIVGPSQHEHAPEINRFCASLVGGDMKTEKNTRIGSLHDVIIPVMGKSFTSVAIREVDASLYFPDAMEWANYVASTPQVREATGLDAEQLLPLAIEYSTIHDCLAVSKYMTVVRAGR